MALFNEIFNTFRWKCIKCGVKYFYNKGIYKDSNLEVHCPICKSVEKEPYFDEYIHKFICGSFTIKPENSENIQCPEHKECKRISFEKRGQRNDGRIPTISKIFTNTSIISIITIMANHSKWWSRKELKEYKGSEDQKGIILELTKEAITQYIDFLAGIGILDEVTSIIKKTSIKLRINKNSNLNEYYYNYIGKNYEIDFEDNSTKKIYEYLQKMSQQWISKTDLIKNAFATDESDLVLTCFEDSNDHSNNELRSRFRSSISFLNKKGLIRCKTFKELVELEVGFKLLDQIHNEKYYRYNSKAFNDVRGELVDFAKKINSENLRTKTKEKMIEEAQFDLFLKNTQNLTDMCNACLIPSNGLGTTYFLSKNRSTLLGRNSDADVFIGDLNLSRNNSIEIIYKNGDYYIFNSGHNPYTKLNDDIINERTVLNNGDKINVGNESFYFVNVDKKQMIDNNTII